MFKVTPIGSCRITAPLRHGHNNYGIQLNLDRCYGYCHSPAEALQMARFMQGHSKLNSNVWPLISRSHELEDISASRHDTSDLYVIELASAKEITIDGVAVQLNYLNSAYSGFFADSGRAQEFWACAVQDDATAMSDFLGSAWSETELQRVQSAMLGKIRLELATRESLRRNIRKLAETLPDVLFVTHIDACKPNGETIRSRSAFIQMVAEEVEQAGCKFYNPTRLMDEFGQSAAIEDESTGLAHFTPAFSEAVMDEWMRQFIAPKTDLAIRSGQTGALKHQLQPQITAAHQDGRFADATSRLHTLSLENERVQPLLQETVQNTLAAQNAFVERAAAALETVLSADDRNRLVLEAAQLGMFDAALDLATRTQGELVSLPAHILLRVADWSLEAGDTDNAFEFFFAAVCQPYSPDRAKTALAALAIEEEIDLLAEFDARSVAGFLSHLKPVQRLELLRLNGHAFSAAISETTSAEEIAEIATSLATTESLDKGADALAYWRDLNQTDRITDQTLLALLGHWLEAALAVTDPILRSRAVGSVLRAAPRFQPARDAMREIRTELTLRIRAAGRDADINALDALTAEVEALEGGLAEFDLWRARLSYGLGHFDTALEHGRAAAAMLPEKINIWVLLMRAAGETDKSEMAAEFAQKVIDLSCTETEKLKTEAEAVLQSHMVGA